MKCKENFAKLIDYKHDRMSYKLLRFRLDRYKRKILFI